MSEADEMLDVMLSKMRSEMCYTEEEMAEVERRALVDWNVSVYRAQYRRKLDRAAVAAEHVAEELVAAYVAQEPER